MLGRIVDEGVSVAEAIIITLTRTPSTRSQMAMRLNQRMGFHLGITPIPTAHRYSKYPTRVSTGMVHPEAAVAVLALSPFRTRQCTRDLQDSPCHRSRLAVPSSTIIRLCSP